MKRLHRWVCLVLLVLAGAIAPVTAQVDEYRDTLFVHNAVISGLSACAECDTYLVIKKDTVYLSTRSATPTFALDTFFVAYTCDTTLTGWVFSGDTIWVDTCSASSVVNQLWQLNSSVLLPTTLSHSVGVGNINNKITYDGASGMLLYGHPSHIEFWAGGTRYLRLNKTGSVYFGPTTDNNLDLGRSTAEFKDAYFDGMVYADGLHLEALNYAAAGKPRLVLDGSFVKMDTTTTTATPVFAADTFFVAYTCDTNLTGWIFSGDTIWVDTCNTTVPLTSLWYKGTGSGSLRSQLNSKASGSNSIAIGIGTYASGASSFSSGFNFATTSPTASGTGAFSHQLTAAGVMHGNAGGDWSAVLGGQQNNIGTSGAGAAIIGGSWNGIDGSDVWSNANNGSPSAIITSTGTWIHHSNLRSAIISSVNSNIPSGLNGVTLLNMVDFTATDSNTVYVPSLTAKGNVLPFTDNTYDIGSTTKEWKDGYFDGVLYSDSVSIGTQNKYAPLYIHAPSDPMGDNTDTIMSFGFADSSVSTEYDGFISIITDEVTYGNKGDNAALSGRIASTLIARQSNTIVSVADSRFAPQGGSDVDLGATGFPWRDGYFSRNFSIGDCLKMGRETALPSSPASGWIVNHNDTLKFYNGTIWKNITF